MGLHRCAALQDHRTTPNRLLPDRRQATGLRSPHWSGHRARAPPNRRYPGRGCAVSLTCVRPRSMPTSSAAPKVPPRRYTSHQRQANSTPSYPPPGIAPKRWICGERECARARQHAHQARSAPGRTVTDMSMHTPWHVSLLTLSANVRMTAVQAAHPQPRAVGATCCGYTLRRYPQTSPIVPCYFFGPRG